MFLLLSSKISSLYLIWVILFFLSIFSCLFLFWLILFFSSIISFLILFWVVLSFELIGFKLFGFIFFLPKMSFLSFLLNSFLLLDKFLVLSSIKFLSFILTGLDDVWLLFLFDWDNILLLDLLLSTWLSSFCVLPLFLLFEFKHWAITLFLPSFLFIFFIIFLETYSSTFSWTSIIIHSYIK